MLQVQGRTRNLKKHDHLPERHEAKIEIPNEMLQPLFTSLKEIGVLTVELTGGDVSVYPHTATAIETAINCGIQSVMILTNGAIISDDIIKVMSKYKDRCFVQVDLHSLNTEYFLLQSCRNAYFSLFWNLLNYFSIFLLQILLNKA